MLTILFWVFSIILHYNKTVFTSLMAVLSFKHIYLLKINQHNFYIQIGKEKKRENIWKALKAASTHDYSH